MTKEHGHDEKLVRVSVMLEQDQVEGLKELAERYSAELDQRWSVSAVVRVAVGDFLTRLGKMT